MDGYVKGFEIRLTPTRSGWSTRVVERFERIGGAGCDITCCVAKGGARTLEGALCDAAELVRRRAGKASA